jgi:hypothetical protein
MQVDHVQQNARRGDLHFDADTNTRTVNSFALHPIDVARNFGKNIFA